MLKLKKEQFEQSFQKAQREEIFKLKRQTFTQKLPFSVVHYNPEYEMAFNQGQKFLDSGPRQVMDVTSYTIAYISSLASQFEEKDCDEYYDNLEDINEIFKVFNKGFPQIDKACLQILRAFTMPNHKSCANILPHIPDLFEYFQTTQYQELKISCLIIFQNLAGDCYICRDTILSYDIPKQVWQSVKDNKLMNEYMDIILNLVRVQPDISYSKYVDLIEIVHYLLSCCKQEDQLWGILIFIRKAYNIEKTLINYQIIEQIMSIQASNFKIQNEILHIIGIASLNGLEIADELNFKWIIYGINVIYKYTSAKSDAFTKRILKRTLIYLHNIVLEGIKFADYLVDQGYKSIIVNQPKQLKTSKEFHELNLLLLQSCSDQKLHELNTKFSLFKEVCQYLELDLIDEEILKLNFDMMAVLLYRDTQNQSYFEEENVMNRVNYYQSHSNSDIWECCQRIYKIVDNYNK